MTQSDKLKEVLRFAAKSNSFHSVELVGRVFDDEAEAGGMFRLAKGEGLILGQPTMGQGFAVIGIEAKGRAVLLGEIPGPFDPPAPTHQTISVSGGNVQIGNYNTQKVDARLQSIVEAIQGSEMAPAEKEEALSLFGRFVSHPALGNVLQGASVLGQALGA